MLDFFESIKSRKNKCETANYEIIFTPLDKLRYGPEIYLQCLSDKEIAKKYIDAIKKEDIAFFKNTNVKIPTIKDNICQEEKSIFQIAGDYKVRKYSQRNNQKISKMTGNAMWELFKEEKAGHIYKVTFGKNEKMEKLWTETSNKQQRVRIEYDVTEENSVLKIVKFEIT